MNPELPKAIRSALTPKDEAASHPSADLLTAFAEQTLTAGEKERVADHVAGCRQCREVLFLASDADEQPSAILEKPTATAWKPRPKWMALVAKTLFAASGLVIVAGICLRIYLDHENAKYKAVQVAQVTRQQPIAAPSSNTAAPPPSRPEVPRTTHEVKAKPQDTEAKSKSRELETLSPGPPKRPEQSIAAAPPANQPPAIGGAEYRAEAVAPPANAFKDSTARSKAKSFASAQLAKQAGADMRPTASGEVWRITAEGELQHRSQGGWTRALADRSTKFRAICESPNGIWAGGSDAALFHSEDGGVNWKQIVLPAPSQEATDTIVEIHFNDSQHGSIITETGARYATSDGGKQWQRE